MRRLSPAALLLLVACPPAAPPVAPPPPVQPAPPPVFAAPPPAPRLDGSRLLEQALELRAAGDDAAAQQKLDLALEVEPGLALASLERADVALSLGGEPAKVLADARAAATALPENPRAQKLLGQALEEAGDVSGAIAAYERSLALREDDRLRRKLASLHARSGDFAKAAAAWEAIRDGAPGDLGAHLELATIYEKLERPASAEKELRSAVELAPQNAVLRRRLAELYEREGKRREARQERAEADRIDPPVKERKLRPLLPSKR